MSSEEPELQLPDPLDEDLGFLEEFTDIFGTRISLGDVVEWDGREPYDDRPFVAFQEHGEDPSREIVADILIQKFGVNSNDTRRFFAVSSGLNGPRDGVHQTLYISRIQATSNITVRIVAILCKKFGIMPDFLSYLCRLGPQTQDNLAYNSFRNARINLSSVSAYAKSSELSQPCRFKGCYLLKLPMLTINPGAPISSPFEIAHMAVYCYLGHESSFCAVMEDSTHALNARRMLQCRDRTGPGWRRTALQQRLALCFFVLALTDWNISLDHLERLVCEKEPLNPNRQRNPVGSINVPASHSNNPSVESTPSVVTLEWLTATLQTARNAMFANLLNLKSLGSACQGTFTYHDQARFREALESITGEAERQLNRAEQLQSRVQTISAYVNELRLELYHYSARDQLLDQVKLQYISQNFLRGISVVAILLLPGIFVSTLMSTSIFGNNDRIAVWFIIAIPLTAVATLSVLYAWRLPIIYQQIKSEGFRKWFRHMNLPSDVDSVH